MAINDLLTQDEIDALLQGVSCGEIDTHYDDEHGEGVVIPYDFFNPDTVTRRRIPALDLINERFARNFRDSLFNLLRRKVEVSVMDVELVNFSDYQSSLFEPVSLNMIKVKPLRGTGMCVLDPKLVFIVVDQFFGGVGRSYVKAEGRKFAPTEQRMIQIILDNVFSDLMKAWQPIMKIDIEFIRSESDPRFSNDVGVSEPVVVTRFHIDLEGGGGDLHITLPHAMLKPINELLDAGEHNELPHINEQFTRALEEEVKQTQVEVTSIVTVTEICLRDINDLKQGDIIPMEMPSQAMLMVNDIPIFKGKFGTHNGKWAVKIQGDFNRNNLSS